MTYILVKDGTKIWPRRGESPVPYEATMGRTEEALRASGEWPADIVQLQVVREDRPTFDPWTQKIRRLDPVDADGTRTYGWSVEPLTPEELAARAEADAEAERREQVRAVLVAMRDGVGTAAERMARLERVVFQLAKEVLG